MKSSSKSILNRYKNLLNILAEQHELTTEEVENKLNLTSKVIWRDISVLSELGLVVKKRGRVCLRNNTAFDRRIRQSHLGKRAIAHYVLNEYLMKELSGISTCIFMDAGSTIEILFLEMLKHESIHDVNYNIVTNNISLAAHKYPDNINLIFSGGKYLPQDKCLVGKAVDFFAQYQAKLAVLSSTNVSFMGGYLGHNYSECQTKEAMLRHANEAIIISDHSKFVFLGGELISSFVLEDGDDGENGHKKVLKAKFNNGDTKAVKIVTNSDLDRSDYEIGKEFFGPDIELTEEQMKDVMCFAPVVGVPDSIYEQRHVWAN